MARKKSKSGSIRVNFKGVEGRTLVAEGEHSVKVAEISEEKGDAGPYLKWTFEIADGKFEGAKLWTNTSLSKQSLWNLKTMLEALGVEVPDDELDIDFDEVIGSEMMVQVEHETYQGKKQARIVDFWPTDGERDSDEEKEDDGPDFDEMDEDDLRKFIKKNKLDVDPDDHSSEKKLRKAVVAAYEEADEEEEEEDKKGKKAGKKGGKKKKISQDELSEMDQDELEEFCKEHDLDVDFDKLKTLKKMRAAVIDAAEGEDLIEE